MDYSRVKGKIKEKYDTQKNFAEALGISSVSLSSKLNGRTEFKRDEIQKASTLLGFNDTELTDIFFVKPTKKT